jgi:uncharacterized protein involved in exopolysaccharide biosynthesis
VRGKGNDLCPNSSTASVYSGESAGLDAELRESSPPGATFAAADPAILVFAGVLLRRRHMLGALMLSGAVAGLALGLLSRRVYVSGATFIPQSSDTGVPSSLAIAASQFGVSVPSGGNGWGPPIYVEILRSHTVLERVALDTVVLAEEGRRRAAVLDLLKASGSTHAKRVERAIRKLSQIVSATEIRQLGAVRVSVTTGWPSVSFALAQRLVREVNQFNLETRKSQATAERQFAEARTAEAEIALRSAEDRLQFFLQNNRSIAGSQELSFEADRLRREVNLRQQVYTSLVQNREEAKLREVRDTPVITVLEEPRLPIVSESRKSLQKALFGGVLGVIVGVIIAVLDRGLEAAREANSDEARDLVQLIDAATPRFLKRMKRRLPE